MKRLKLAQTTYEYLKNRQEATQGKSWSLSMLYKQDITGKLLLSQGHLCGYCESRLHHKKPQPNSHIEHYKERHLFPELAYSYQNMLLSCMGGMNKDIKSEATVERNLRVEGMSCGHYKTDHHHKHTPPNYKFLLDPFKETYLDFFEYSEEMIIPKKSISKYKKIKAQYTIDRLNLNSFRLLGLRRSILQQVRKDLMKYKQKSAQKRYVSILLNRDNEIYPPFISMIEYHFSWIKTL